MDNPGIMYVTKMFLFEHISIIRAEMIQPAIIGADRMDSTRPLFKSLKIFNVKAVFKYMVSNYIYESISRKENIFIRNESQHNTRQILNEVLCVPYTHSAQTMQSINYSGTISYKTVPVNIRRCQSFVTF